ncbi:SID1 transmembrane family member 1 [Orchesella cincta]|uniref:SID1 transmembrane family member 1 n=1 Tax=Orchesella cincta TaxID=48709 RepID=A0A1D2MUE9_ORCCI|nr:SID1 transmembrane family member 1 [Orchesella cincta]
MMWPAWQLQFYAEAEPPENRTVKTNYPLLATAYWHGSIRSWEIPVHFLNDTKDLKRIRRFSDDTVGKVLWHYRENKCESWNLTVEISVYNDVMIYYRLKIVLLQDFLVAPNTMVAGIATSSSPSVFMFMPPPDWHYVFIEAASNSDICTLVGVKELKQGPFLDQIDGAADMQFSETFTLKTGLTLRRDEFPNGFLLIFNPFLNDLKCQQNASLQNHPFRKKDFRFVIREGMSPSDYFLPLLAPVLLITCCGLTAFIFQRKFTQLRCDMISGKKECPPIQRQHRLFKSNIKISDIIIEEPNRVVAQSQRYCRWIFISTAFYSLPVFQLMRTFRERLQETGNFDICYFNHYCSHMLGPYHDFNHMYSNVGYLLFGLFYGAIVRYRQTSRNPMYTAQQDREQEGYSLKTYICIADTVFMYTIAALTVVTIYQFRHPTYLSAEWPTCSPLDDLKHRRLFHVQRDDWIAPHDSEIIIIHGPGRIVLPGFLLIINTLSLLAIWTVFESQNFATQVLFICVINGSLYTIFYCALKWFHGECRRLVWIQPGFYLFTSLTLWGIAIYFFFHEGSTWEASPAESRIQNNDCIIFGFYDSHDMWHFLSSAGLFCTAMLLLTVDDDLVDQPKSTIPVF